MTSPTVCIDVSRFRRALYEWFLVRGRQFPWRETQDAYAILIAGTLLHRTRADQVVAVYREFLRKWPDVRKLAEAQEKDVAEVLRPVGLRWRVPLLLKTAQMIVSKFRGRVPVNREDLQRLPGVGHYIASLVSCLAGGKPEIIQDAGTVRIVSRLFGLPLTDSARRSSVFRSILRELVDPEHPREFNLAMIDLAALVCRPRHPLCGECPVREFCRHGGFQ